MGDNQALNRGCPIDHKAPSSGIKAKGNPLAGGCPVDHRSKASTSREEPPDRDDRPIHPCMRKVDAKPTTLDPKDEIPEAYIPASGRGNSDDGKRWLNPSANQLYRALKRKNKPIESEDSPSMADVHTAVTDGTWSAIMEYESFHKDKCPNPTLARFSGKDGIYSFKARVLNMLGLAPLPFDRHDWVVDRCGKEVTYIIDYYAKEDEKGNTEYYTIDARPAHMSGLYDRTKMIFSKWWNGESNW
ncbi:hypothetical protein AAMO2058_000776500 [Amorphochlora amoebiformis]|eukprot:1343536-Amorphochlora_amoeboformis.AAC.1